MLCHIGVNKMKNKTKHFHIKHLCVAVSDDCFIDLDVRCTIEYEKGLHYTFVQSTTIDRVKVDGRPLSYNEEISDIVGKVIFNYIINKLFCKL